MSTAAQSEDIEFLQRRVAAFGLVMFALNVVGFLLRLGVATVVGFGEELDATSIQSWGTHLAAFVPFCAMWLLCRGAPKTEPVVKNIEFGATVLGCCAFIGMGLSIPAVASPELVVAMLLTQFLVVRAAMVPSTAKRTAALAITIGVPYLLGVYVMFASPILVGTDAAVEAEFIPTPAIGVTSGLAWWVMTTLISTLISRVIFGLRREVRAARQLGQYTLEAQIGEGGMGAVYRARHAMLRRPTAIKLLSPERAGGDNIARFEREVQLTAELTHPNTVTIFDYGRTPDGTFYYAMELIDGATLDQVVKLDGPLPPGRVKHILKQAAKALTEAHARGLIHRDIKPANIMLCEQGGVLDVVKVLDFGLVKQQTARQDAAVTGDQTVVGTPMYMAPESIVDPNDVDARSDLYALGAVAYFLLAGEPVFTGKSPVEVLGKHLHEEPVPLSERAEHPVPLALEKIVLDCLAKSRDARPPSAADLVERVEACEVGNEWTATDAAEWWRTKRASLVTPESAPSDGTLTIAVGLQAH